MIDSIVKIAMATPKTCVAAPKSNIKTAIDLACEASKNGAAVIVFPELNVSSVSAGDLFLQSAFLSECEAAVGEYILKTAELDILSFIGAPVKHFGKLYNASIAIKGGEILGISVNGSNTGKYFSSLASLTLPISYAGFYADASEKMIYQHASVPSMRIFVSFGDAATASNAAAAGATLILAPTSLYESIGNATRIVEDLKSVSRINKSAIALVTPNGESTTDFVYSGSAYFASLGSLLAEKEAFSESNLLYATVDLEAVENDRRVCFKYAPSEDYLYIPYMGGVWETEITNINKLPFVFEDDKTLDLTLKMQAHALARRCESAYAKKMVIGISGGLDSTLALIVSAMAADILKIDRKNIVAITMPCFGTTKRTKNNAIALADALSVTVRTVDIKKSVLQHFEDISHPANDYNVVYENAQARERTQVLMDVANELSGIVVGTGDLSELALGFATYNGDHMSSYGVNAGVAKTQLRSLVSYFAKISNKEICDVLTDVLMTPVSPELLPEKDGQIAQCTEDIVGPYELHDFFLYYTLRFGFSPRKVKRLAISAFKGEYDEATVDKWLRIFLKRFITQQFKRSALPDGVKLSEISLSPREGLKMPSDAGYDFLLNSLDGEK